MELVEDWPLTAQAEAVASLESIADYVSLHEASEDDR